MPPSQPPILLAEPLGLPPVARLRLGANQQLLAWTASAQALVRANPDSLRVLQYRLQLHPDPAPLQRALRLVCAPDAAPHAQATLAIHRAGASPLTLRLSRYSAAPGVVQAKVWLADPDLLQLDETALRQAFGFTRTEARVAAALGAGRAPADLALAWGLQTNTVQMHVKRLLAKTHTARQAQLVGLLWRSAALTLAPAPGARPAPLGSGVSAAIHAQPYPDG